MSSPLLELDSVCTQYGQISVLKDVSVTVGSGEVVTIIGANGAGKSTTLLTISGLVKPTRGRILFEGRDISDLPAHTLVKLGIAQVPEGRKIFPRLSVFENLEMGAYLLPDDASRRSDFDRVFSLFPILAERRQQAGGTLSGGEQQMLAIGRALMSRPKLLLLDEPSMGVAPLIVKKIFDTLRGLNESGMTMLLVEQNAHLALKLAARGYVLETGRIVLSDEAVALHSNPRVQEAYLGECQKV